MTTILTGVVHVRRPGSADVTTLNVGDELPEWAVDLVTNPAVLGEYNEPDPEGAPPAEPSGTENPPPSNDAPPSTQDAPAGSDPLTGEQNPPAGDASTRGLLEARAKDLKIKFTDETSDTELEALIASKE